MVHYGLVLELLFSFTYCFAAIYLSDCKEKNCNLLRPLIELLAGIPSVVYGFLLVVIVPLIQSLLVYLLVKLL
jgi:ABC-type phosphate transport system permease subunit